jgi:SAM-dependent methyltransferase
VSIANQDQADHWNGEEAEHWVAEQARYDDMLSAFVDMLLDAAHVASGDRVLDVGCGCGATTIAAARAAAPAQVIGIDLSQPMLARAGVNASSTGVENVAFEQADAQVYQPPEPVDVVFSRFGIMFFADPTAAFANLRRAASTHGRLAFVCWQELAANEWLVVPGAALAQHVPLPNFGGPGAPGMFALSDADGIRRTLSSSGWRNIAVAPGDVPLLVGGTGTLDTAVEFLRTGAIGRRVLGGTEPEAAARAVEAVRDALAPYVTADGVRLQGAVWLVTATTEA